MVRFPQVIRYKTVTQGEAYQNADGDWVAGDIVETEVSAECRIEPNGKGDRTPNQDGVLVEYGFTVYMPGDVVAIPFGQYVEVFEGLNIVAKGECKRFHRFQRNCQAWV